MNNTTNVENPSEDVDGYAYYSMGFSLGILLLIVVITLTSYYCSRRTLHDLQSHQRNATTGSNRGGGFLTAAAAMERESTVINIQVGLDEAILNSYPVLSYSQAKLHEADSTTSCCSICLADYKDTESLRLLPDCGHFFHRKCIDPWLRLSSSCPVCRTSPLPTPLSTPLTEVTPFAARRD